MRKKVLFCILTAIMTCFLLQISAYADMGPKPSVNLSFSNVQDSVYYVTLLSKQKSTGPYSYSTRPLDENSFLVSEHTQEGLEAWQAFRDYRDDDGFYFIEFFKRSNGQNTFNWTYYPPDTFKILVYFPETKSFAASGINEKYAFDSYYEVSLAENGSALTLKKNYDYSAEVISLIVRILLTIAVESLIALLFGLRKRDILLLILAVNSATQITLNLLLNFFNYTSGGFAYILNYILLELLIIIVEAIVFSRCFKRMSFESNIKGWTAPVYSITANSVSFALGIFISIKLPGIF